MKQVGIFVIFIFLIMSCKKNDYTNGIYTSDNKEDTMYLSIIESQSKFLLLCNKVEEINPIDATISSSEILSGNIKLRKDTIYLFDEKHRVYFLKRINDLRIEVINFSPYYKEHSILYISKKFDTSGKIIYSANWKNGKKDGIWSYYKKDYVLRVYYKNGILLKKERLE